MRALCSGMNGSLQARIQFVDGTGRIRSEDLAWLGDAMGRALALLHVGGEVRVKLVDDAEMAAAHEEFAGVPGTTDVLTFDLSDPEENPNTEPSVELGAGGKIFVRKKIVIDTDILACVDEAERQIKGRKHPLNRELLLYSLHGVLHCLGFDDHEEADSVRMHAMEDAVLTQIGVGAAYRGEAAGEG